MKVYEEHEKKTNGFIPDDLETRGRSSFYLLYGIKFPITTFDLDDYNHLGPLLDKLKEDPGLVAMFSTNCTKLYMFFKNKTFRDEHLQEFCDILGKKKMHHCR